MRILDRPAAVSSAKIFNNTLATVLERMGRAFEDWSKSEDLPKRCMIDKPSGIKVARFGLDFFYKGCALRQGLCRKTISSQDSAI